MWDEGYSYPFSPDVAWPGISRPAAMMGRVSGSADGTVG